MEGRDGDDLAAMYGAAAVFGFVFGSSLHAVRFGVHQAGAAIFAGASFAFGHVVALAASLALLVSAGQLLHQSLEDTIGIFAADVLTFTAVGLIGGAVGAGVTAALRQRFLPAASGAG